MDHTRRSFIAFASVSSLAIAGCIGSDSEGGDDHDDDQHHDDDHDDDQHHDDDHDDDHHHGHMEIAEFEIIDRSEDGVAAYIHGDHWHGELPPVEVGEHVSLGADVEDDDGNEIVLGSDEEYELRVRIGDNAADDLVDFDFHGDHVHISGVEAGVTDVVFQLWHDDHADYETPELTVQVIDD